MKVSELSGAMLDYWAARADGVPHDALCFVGGNKPNWWEACSIMGGGMFRPSTKWEQGGPIIEREGIAVLMGENQDMFPGWCAFVGRVGPSDFEEDWIMGETALIAAMRAYVASKYGDEVPDENTLQK